MPTTLDLRDVDIKQTIDPSRLDMGFVGQDCALIAQTFERGAHNTPTEAAVFATLTRTLQNHSKVAGTLINSVESYLRSPQEAADNATAQAQQFASSANGSDTSGSAGADAIQSFNFGTQQASSFGDSFGEKLLDTLRDCIPCDFRLMSMLELHPNFDMLKSFEDYLKKLLGMLGSITDMLRNLDAFGDFCSLIDSLSFMCIPDLQRAMAILMALFTLEATEMTGLLGFLQSLVAPLFGPILMSVTSLLDQFVTLVNNPLKCMIDAINSKLAQSGKAIPAYSSSGDPNSALNASLGLLATQLREGETRIRAKLDFYVSQAKALMGDLGAGDAAYLQAKMRSLQIIRMLAFIAAVISALSKGRLSCSAENKGSANTELDNFMANFLNPNSAFRIWVDDDGALHLDEKTDDVLPEVKNVLEFEGEVPFDIAEDVEKINTGLSEPIRVSLPCKLETSVGEAEKLNAWISELNNF